jgi:alpha-L-arabinofuranosidase
MFSYSDRFSDWGSFRRSGWGPFEMADYCDAAGVEMVFTTYDGGVTKAPGTPQDFADLVEYCYGNSSTLWGRTRIVDDKHPKPFRIRYFELVSIVHRKSALTFVCDDYLVLTDRI